MFIISITYKVDLSLIEPHLAAHRAFLDKYYRNGMFILSGAKAPRTGGVIIARASRRVIVDAIVKEDPFYKAGFADYSVVEFVPSMARVGLESLLES